MSATTYTFEAPAPADKPQKALPTRAFGLITLVTVFLQRIGYSMQIGGQFYPFPLSVAVMPAVSIWLLVKGWSRPIPVRMALYAAVVACATLSYLLNTDGPAISIMSMLMFAFLYFPMMFPVALDRETFLRFYRTVANICSVVCVIGAASYVLQFVIRTELWFSWRTVVPQQFLIEFNSLNYFTYGGGIYKANGFFLMEASWQSQLAARALLITTFILKDWRYLVPLGLGLLTAFSGTGFMLFGIFCLGPILVLMMRKQTTLVLLAFGAVLVPLALFAFSEQLRVDQMIGRLNEFNTPTSSGYIRFVASQEAVRRFTSGDFLAILFGSGPGMGEFFVRGMQGDGFLPGWAKVFVEYGMLGLIALTSFLFYCVWHTTGSRWIACAFAFQFLYLDGSAVVPQQVYLTLWLGALVFVDKTKQPASAQPARTLNPAEQHG